MKIPTKNGQAAMRPRSHRPDHRRGGWPRAVLAILILASWPAADSPPAGADPADEPVARVNGRPISSGEFELAVQLQFADRRPGRIGVAELRTMREKVLERLIEGELLHQQATARGVNVDDADVVKELDRMRSRFESEEDFRATLQRNGTTEGAFREQVRRSLVIARFIDREILRGLKVPQDEIRRYYDQNPREMVRRESVPVRQIVIRVDPDAPRAERVEAREKIEAILGEVRGGADFSEMARRYSEGPGASEGGDRGILIRGAGAPRAIERAAFSLRSGEVSDVLETIQGFHLIQVGDRRPSGTIPFDEAREPIREKLEARQREEKLRAYVESLREKARIERLLPETP